MQTDPPSLPNPIEPEQGDLFLLERESLINLVELLHTTAPEVDVRLEPASVMRAVIITRAGPKTRISEPNADAAGMAKQIYQFRRRRDTLLPADLFGEPAWDILLDLYIAEKEGRRICISSACIAAAVPSTTALRWIRELEARGLLHREDDPDDARRAYVRLTGTAAAALEHLFI